MKKLYNLSAPQNSILLTEQFYQGTSINNIGGTSFVTDSLNFDILKKAINNFIKYNDSFRIRLTQENNTVKQYIEDFSEFDIEIIDVKTEDDVKKIEENLINTKFDIFNERLFDTKIFKFKENVGGYMFVMHHLISDAWTTSLICKKVMHEYYNLINNIDESSKTYSYLKYLESEKDYFSSNKFEKDKSYWTEKFKTVPNIVSIPTQTNNKNDFSCNADRQSFTLSKQEVEKIEDFCKQDSVSLFNFFMSILAIYIHKINNTDDFVIRYTYFKQDKCY